MDPRGQTEYKIQRNSTRKNGQPEDKILQRNPQARTNRWSGATKLWTVRGQLDSVTEPTRTNAQTDRSRNEAMDRTRTDGQMNGGTDEIADSTTTFIPTTYHNLNDHYPCLLDLDFHCHFHYHALAQPSGKRLSLLLASCLHCGRRKSRWGK